MRPLAIVKGQITANRDAGLGHAVISPQIHLLVFDAAPEPLDKDVVAPGPFAIHADRDLVLEQHAGEVVAGELTTLIGVEDLRPLIPGKRLLHGLDAEGCLQGNGQPPGQHPPAEPVHHRREQVAQHPAARKRVRQMQFVHPPHDGQIGCRGRLRLIIEAAPADPELLGLPGQRQGMRAIDHRLALGHTPALPSACSKKSLARVNSPILACSVFTSTGGLADAACSAPNTPAAPSRSWAFHWVIWLGCTSNCWASSARVFSPFTAARAPLALKAGEWFRRGLLLIVSPVRQPFWPRSGRNSTYPAVQISRASSERVRTLAA